MAIKVVTDSTCDIPNEMAQSLGITVVPVEVVFGTETFKDGVELSPDEFYRRLTEGDVHPTTSQPAPGEFVRIFEELGRDADGIVSIHISGKLSRTLNAAEQAKSQADTDCPIEVVDSYHASMGLGLIAMAAARAANEGGDLNQVAEVARDTAGRAQCFPVLDTLEYLQKGGRIGRARALLGALLKVKPIIIVRDGEVQPLGRARTFAKGVALLQDTARKFAPLEELCVIYSTTPDAAQEVADNLGDLLPEGKAPFIARFGPSLGTHVGPGSLGIALLEAKPEGA